MCMFAWNIKEDQKEDSKKADFSSLHSDLRVTFWKDKLLKLNSVQSPVQASCVTQFEEKLVTLQPPISDLRKNSGLESLRFF